MKVGDFANSQFGWVCRSCGKDGKGWADIKAHMVEHREIEAAARDLGAEGSDFPLRIVGIPNTEETT